MNELLLVLSLVVIYSGVLLAYRLFGKAGLYGFTATATVLANIEVLILINAFGFEQTLGNVLFASTFLISDILNENEGKREANTAVNIGIFTAAFMVLITSLWLKFTPSQGDWAFPAIESLFSITPRLLFASLIALIASQKLDIILYRLIWKATSKKGDERAFLWLRNNGSTLLSQVINTLLFNLIAFFGIYPARTLISIIISGYIVYFFLSLLGTPFIYLSRKIKKGDK